MDYKQSIETPELNANKGFLACGAVGYIFTWFRILDLKSERLIQVHLKRVLLFGNIADQLN